MGRWAARGNFFVHRRRTRGFCFFFLFSFKSICDFDPSPFWRRIQEWNSFLCILSLSLSLSPSFYRIKCYYLYIPSAALDVAWSLDPLSALRSNPVRFPYDFFQFSFLWPGIWKFFFFFFLNSFFSSLHVYSRLEGTRPFAARLFFVSIIPASPIHFLAPNLFKFKNDSN